MAPRSGLHERTQLLDFVHIVDIPVSALEVQTVMYSRALGSEPLLQLTLRLESVI